MAKNRRQIFLVDAPVQWAIVRQSLLHWLCFSLAAVLFLAFLQLLLGGVFKPWSEHWQAIWPMAVSVYLSFLVLLPMFVYDSFKLSNRFAGPIKRVRRVLRELAEGKPFAPVKFRKGDFWAELADELNAAVQTLSSRAAAEEPEPPDHGGSDPQESLEMSVK